MSTNSECSTVSTVPMYCTYTGRPTVRTDVQYKYSYGTGIRVLKKILQNIRSSISYYSILYVYCKFRVNSENGESHQNRTLYLYQAFIYFFLENAISPITYILQYILYLYILLVIERFVLISLIWYIITGFVLISNVL